MFESLWVRKLSAQSVTLLGEPRVNLLSAAFTLPKLFSSLSVLGSTEKSRPGSLPTGNGQFVQAAATAGAVTFNL